VLSYFFILVLNARVISPRTTRTSPGRERWAWGSVAWRKRRIDPRARLIKPPKTTKFFSISDSFFLNEH